MRRRPSLTATSTPSKRAWTRVLTSSAREQRKRAGRHKTVIEYIAVPGDISLGEEQLRDLLYAAGIITGGSRHGSDAKHWRVEHHMSIPRLLSGACQVRTG